MASQARGMETKREAFIEMDGCGGLHRNRLGHVPLLPQDDQVQVLDRYCLIGILLDLPLASMQYPIFLNCYLIYEVVCTFVF
jgi:hypothetical protein